MRKSSEMLLLGAALAAGVMGMSTLGAIEPSFDRAPQPTKPPGKNRDKIKAARKQNRKRRQAKAKGAS